MMIITMIKIIRIRYQFETTVDHLVVASPEHTKRDYIKHPVGIGIYTHKALCEQYDNNLADHW